MAFYRVQQNKEDKPILIGTYNNVQSITIDVSMYPNKTIDNFILEIPGFTTDGTVSGTTSTSYKTCGTTLRAFTPTKTLIDGKLTIGGIIYNDIGFPSGNGRRTVYGRPNIKVWVI